MSVLFIAVPAALLLSGLAVWAFIWAVGEGQFDDMTTPAYRPLLDDEPGSAEARGSGSPGKVADKPGSAESMDEGR